MLAANHEMNDRKQCSFVAASSQNKWADVVVASIEAETSPKTSLEKWHRYQRLLAEVGF
jgi:hypothetical protein